MQLWYEPLAVIEYRGHLNKAGDSQGHYICDVKCNSNNQWYRTNDNCKPKKLDMNEVSQYGYVFLYKRLND